MINRTALVFHIELYIYIFFCSAICKSFFNDIDFCDFIYEKQKKRGNGKYLYFLMLWEFRRTVSEEGGFFLYVYLKDTL